MEQNEIWRLMVSSASLFHRMRKLKLDEGHFSHLFWGSRYVAFALQDLMLGYGKPISEIFKLLNDVGGEVFNLQHSVYFLEGIEERTAMACFLGSLACAALEQWLGVNNPLCVLDTAVWKDILKIVENAVYHHELMETLD